MDRSKGPPRGSDRTGMLPHLEPPMSKRNRRQFLEESLLATAAAAAFAAKSLVAAEDDPRVTANDKVGAAIIGCGIRGKQHARELVRQEGCEILYVCDP